MRSISRQLILFPADVFRNFDTFSIRSHKNLFSIICEISLYSLSCLCTSLYLMLLKFPMLWPGILGGLSGNFEQQLIFFVNEAKKPLK